jgi:hypothetical protein
MNTGKMIGKSMAGKSISLPFANAERGERSVTVVDIGRDEIKREIKRRKKSPLRLKSA